MNLALAEVAGAMLVVSQFTLWAMSQGPSASFVAGAPPEWPSLYSLRICRGRARHSSRDGKISRAHGREPDERRPVTLLIEANANSESALRSIDACQSRGLGQGSGLLIVRQARCWR